MSAQPDTRFPPEAKAYGKNAAVSVAVASDQKNWIVKLAPRTDTQRFAWQNAISIHLDTVEAACLAAVLQGLLPTLPDPDTGTPDGGIFHESPSGKRKLIARNIGTFTGIRLYEWNDSSRRDLSLRIAPRGRFLISTMITLTLPIIAAHTRMGGMHTLLAQTDGEKLVQWCAKIFTSRAHNTPRDY